MFQRNSSLYTKILNFLPVTVVLLYIAALYSIFIIGIVVDHPSPVEIFGILILHIFLTIGFVGFFRCVFTPPGFVKENFILEGFPENEKCFKLEEMLDQDYELGKVSFCEQCQSYRPPRSRHCRICKKCVLRFDHHCPWVGNCVGLKNHKFFIQFLFHFGVSGMIVGAIGISAIFQDQHHKLILKIISAFGITSGFGLIAFAGMQVYLIAMNKSMLEYRFRGSSIFDTGNTTENLKQIFDGKWINWVLPLRKTSFDGVIYPMNVRTKDGGVIFLRNSYLI